ncbi:bacterial-type Gcn5-like N-acetyltransferase, putative [Bodo saltans]|uniref:Bacterial-type Gcn5-like N-acetyltransferase, putative n=1 Tax=Bodo saltans TaxID=75058 RepID=A0A0S4J9Z9_BODSA|nr:bacterial-type Gcn5-like N-acetyltransferase, putative [Bodo saltans]|eukprot:CUG86922.1 bacterial-type Gcn5-like N-acetyltransferase, putative [Bodo saltans]
MAMETEKLALDPPTVVRGVTVPFMKENVADYFVVEYDASSAAATGTDATAESTTTTTTTYHPMVAMLMITYEWSDWRAGSIHWIQSVYTHPDHRRKGLFGQLFSFVKKRVDDDPDAAAIRLYAEHDNHSAINTYKKMGLEVEEHYRMMRWSKLGY